MDNKTIIDKIQKYSVNSYYAENNNKIAIKLYSNIGIWFYLIIYKADGKIQNLCKYKTTGKIAWNVIELKEFYKTFVRKKFELIDLCKTKPKELKNIKADYSVKFDVEKINVFIKQDDLFIDFYKFGYYIKCKRRSKNGITDSTEKININDYVTNQYLLEMFGELVKKYKA